MGKLRVSCVRVFCEVCMCRTRCGCIHVYAVQFVPSSRGAAVPAVCDGLDDVLGQDQDGSPSARQGGLLSSLPAVQRRTRGRDLAGHLEWAGHMHVGDVKWVGHVGTLYFKLVYAPIHHLN